MALVSIDPKALEHACLSAGRSVHHFDRMGDDLPLRSSIVAHARAIERIEATEARHAAELREQAERFSEAVKRYYGINGCPPHPILAPFILPAPDPLVELVQEAFSAMLRANSPDGVTEALRAALAARGGKIVWEAGE